MQNTFRAIELTEKNLDVIANSGEISRADVQALYETTVDCPGGSPRLFIADYLEIGWFAPTVEFFNEHFFWTERDKTGFRHCKRK